MKGIQIARFCLVPCLVVAAAVSAGTYTWEDEQGVVHMTDTPPPGDQERLEPPSSGESPEKSPDPALKERVTPSTSDALRSRAGNQSSVGDDPVFREAEQAMAKGDGKRALGLLLPLAERGHPRAQNGVALILCQGMGVPMDTAAGIQWHLRAAEQGYSLAEFYLGLIYADGHGVARDPAQGARWMKRAAVHGFAQAQFNLGRMYATGEGVEMDARQAAEWYLKASEQGEPSAQHNLAAMYLAGTGVAQDKTQAYRWELRG
jgi:TPR repeat protein